MVVVKLSSKQEVVKLGSHQGAVKVSAHQQAMTMKLHTNGAPLLAKISTNLQNNGAPLNVSEVAPLIVHPELPRAATTSPKPTVTVTECRHKSP